MVTRALPDLISYAAAASAVANYWRLKANSIFRCLNCHQTDTDCKFYFVPCRASEPASQPTYTTKHKFPSYKNKQHSHNLYLSSSLLFFQIYSKFLQQKQQRRRQALAKDKTKFWRQFRESKHTKKLEIKFINFAAKRLKMVYCVFS